MVTRAVVIRPDIILCALTRQYLATAIAEPDVTTFFPSSTLYHNLVTIKQKVASLAVVKKNGSLAGLILFKQASLGARLGARDRP